MIHQQFFYLLYRRVRFRSAPAAPKDQNSVQEGSCTHLTRPAQSAKRPMTNAVTNTLSIIAVIAKFSIEQIRSRQLDLNEVGLLEDYCFPWEWERFVQDTEAVSDCDFEAVRRELELSAAALALAFTDEFAEGWLEDYLKRAAEDLAQQAETYSDSEAFDYLLETELENWMQDAVHDTDWKAEADWMLSCSVFNEFKDAERNATIQQLDELENIKEEYTEQLSGMLEQEAEYLTSEFFPEATIIPDRERIMIYLNDYVSECDHFGEVFENAREAMEAAVSKQQQGSGTDSDIFGITEGLNDFTEQQYIRDTFAVQHQPSLSQPVDYYAYKHA